MWPHHTDPKISNTRDLQVIKIVHPNYAHGLKPSKLSHSHNTQDFNHLHAYTYLYILLYMSTQKHATSTIRGDKQNFGILHTSEHFMVDVPHLDHLWDGQKDHHSNEKIIWCMRIRTTNMPNGMLL